MNYVNSSMPSQHLTRIIAVQITYAFLINETDNPDLLIKNIKESFFATIEYNTVYLDTLIKYMSANHLQYNEIIARHLSHTWSIERISQMILAIIYMSITEMHCYIELEKKIILNEYVNIAREFLSIKEVNFINAILDKIASTISSQDNLVYDNRDN